GLSCLGQRLVGWKQVRAANKPQDSQFFLQPCPKDSFVMSGTLVRMRSYSRSYAEKTRFLPLLFFALLVASRIFAVEEEIKQITQTGQMLKKEGQVNYLQSNR